MKFGILGYGYVGKATHKGIVKDNSTSIFDTASHNTEEQYKDLVSCDTVFICIPTVTDKDIDIIIDEIKKLKKEGVASIIIRSTLPLGANDKIQESVGDVIYIPEFLRERYWETDCLKRPLIIGCNGNVPDWLKKEDHMVCSHKEAELVKMFSNNYNVVRIAFANAFYDLSQNVGANYDVVKDMYLAVAQKQTYLNMPGYDGSRGFGGKCLPKDLDFLINTLDDLNLEHDWFKTIRELNKGWSNKL